jgi:hypothetical protein
VKAHNQIDTSMGRVNLHVRAILKNPKKGKFYLRGIMRELCNVSLMDSVIICGAATILLLIAIDKLIN